MYVLLVKIEYFKSRKNKLIKIDPNASDIVEYNNHYFSNTFFFKKNVLIIIK